MLSTEFILHTDCLFLCHPPASFFLINAVITIHREQNCFYLNHVSRNSEYRPCSLHKAVGESVLYMSSWSVVASEFGCIELSYAKPEMLTRGWALTELSENQVSCRLVG